MDKIIIIIIIIIVIIVIIRIIIINIVINVIYCAGRVRYSIVILFSPTPNGRSRETEEITDFCKRFRFSFCVSCCSMYFGFLFLFRSK